MPPDKPAEQISVEDVLYQLGMRRDSAAVHYERTFYRHAIDVLEYLAARAKVAELIEELANDYHEAVEIMQWTDSFEVTRYFDNDKHQQQAHWYSAKTILEALTAAVDAKRRSTGVTETRKDNQ